VSAKDRAAFHHDKAEQALAPARELLTQLRVPHTDHVELGNRAETINRMAQQLQVTGILMGTARRNSFTRLMEDSVTSRVIQHAQVPVEVVAGDAVSSFERFGVPASAAAAIVLLVVSVE
jgi:nucleotide-binding universal stress UspA family protein